MRPEQSPLLRPRFLRRGFGCLRRLQHVADQDAVAPGGVPHQHVGHGTDELPVLQNGGAPWIDRGNIVALGSDIHGTEIGYSQYLRAADWLGERMDSIEQRVRELLRDAL